MDKDQHTIEDFKNFSKTTKARIVQQFGFHVNHEIDSDYNLIHVYALHSYFVVLKMLAPDPDKRPYKPIMEWDSEIEAHTPEMMGILYPNIALDTEWISNSELQSALKTKMRVINAERRTFKINYIIR